MTCVNYPFRTELTYPPLFIPVVMKVDIARKKIIKFNLFAHLSSEMGNQYLILKWQSHTTNIEIWCIWPLANTLTSILSLNTLIYIWLAYLCLKGVSSFTRRSTLTPSCGTWNQFQCFIGPDWLASKSFCIIPVTTPAMKSPRSLKDLHVIFASPLLPPLPWCCPEDSWSCMLFLHHPCYHPCHEVE